MPKSFQIFSRISFAFIVIIIGHYVIAAQTLTGTWSANNSVWNGKNTDWNDNNQNSQDKIHLNFKYRTSDGETSSNGTSFSYGEVQNLTAAQVEAVISPVKFSIVREAGTIECEGNFRNGKGDGTFRFTANPQFISAMKTRGFDFTATSSKNNRGDSLENRLFAATTINVTTALADDLLSANFGKLEVDDLFKAAIFKVDSKFMKEMKASGFPNLDFDDLVKARIFKIDGEYLSQLNKAGFGKESFENIVKMRIFKITPEYVAEVRNSGFSNVDIEDLVKMKIFNIDRQFIQKAKAEGVPLNVEDLVQRRIGVWRK